MLSVLMSTAQWQGYTCVLVLNLWVKRQWGFAVGGGRRRSGFLSSLVKCLLSGRIPSGVCLATNYTAKLH